VHGTGSDRLSSHIFLKSTSVNVSVKGMLPVPHRRGWGGVRCSEPGRVGASLVARKALTTK
jgi:hypothetical protein